MNFPHIHLLLNHIPVLGTAFAFLLLAWAMFRRSDELRRIALVAFILVALASIPTYLTGEPAGEMLVNQRAGVSSWQIERHDAAAEVALTSVLSLGGLALLLLGMEWKKIAIPRFLRMLTPLVAIVVLGLMAWTATLGGQIRHPELGGTAPRIELPIRD